MEIAPQLLTEPLLQYEDQYFGHARIYEPPWRPPISHLAHSPQAQLQKKLVKSSHALPMPWIWYMGLPNFVVHQSKILCRRTKCHLQMKIMSHGVGPRYT